MILLLDVGNTNIKIGVSDKTKILKSWRIATDYTKTADEYGMIFYDLLNSVKYKFEDFEGIIMSSVAPSLNYTIEHMCVFYTGIKPLMVSHKLKTGLIFNYKFPEELGADRIVNAVGAYSFYKSAVIVIDFGSATTFGVVNADGVFLGGAIAPGIKSSAESLTKTAAKLPRIELSHPKTVIGKTTVENMQAGVIFGFRGLVKEIIEKIKEESRISDLKIVATGGMSELITAGDKDKIFDVTDRSLSLKSLQLLYNLNKN